MWWWGSKQSRVYHIGDEKSVKWLVLWLSGSESRCLHEQQQRGIQMSNVVIVRIDLDSYPVDMLERLVQDGVITLAEARTSKNVEELEAYERMMWVRKVQSRSAGVRRSA